MPHILVKTLYLNDTSKADLEDVISDAKEAIQRSREKLMMLAASTPRQMTDVEGNPFDWVDHVQMEVKQEMDYLEENIWRHRLAEYAMANPDNTEDLE
jgi:hypothetical protein